MENQTSALIVDWRTVLALNLVTGWIIIKKQLSQIDVRLPCSSAMTIISKWHIRFPWNLAWISYFGPEVVWLFSCLL